MQRSVIGWFLALALWCGACEENPTGQDATRSGAIPDDSGALGSVADARAQGAPPSAPPGGTTLDASNPGNAGAGLDASAPLGDAHVAANDASITPHDADAAPLNPPGDASSAADGAALGDAALAACTGKPGMRRGKSKQSVKLGSATRTFVYYAPENLDPNRPVPLVIVPHGYTQSGEEMFQITKYPMVADREGFVAVFPDGAPGSIGPWDVGSGVCGNGASVPGSGDDQGFVDALIAFASADQCIDTRHIFMTGWSMGGYLSHHSGCLRDDLRAIGPHSGGTHDLSKCKTQKKPVIMFHFDPDGLIDYSCGAKARDAWIARNGCDRNQPDVKTVKGGKCEYYRGCPAEAQVAFCTFEIPSNHRGDFLAGHAWSGGNPRAYSIAETESAAELGWQFFKTYAW